MRRVNENIEHWIVRRLDGEIGPDEALDLDREIIRNPEALHTQDDYQRIDELASAALQEVLSNAGPSFDPAALPDRPLRVPARRIHRGWWLVSGAIAAALLALAIPRPAIQLSEVPNLVVQRKLPTAPGRSIRNPVPSVRAPAQRDLMRNVGTTQPTMRRQTGRDVLGIIGENGSIYWIEVDHIRTITRPERPSRGWRGETL